MAPAATIQNDAVHRATSEIRAISPKFAAAAEHLGVAMRGTYLKLLDAIEAADVPSIGAIYERISQSTLVSGLAAKLHAMCDELNRLLEVVKPFAGVALGVIVGLAGYAVGGMVGPVLVFAGFLFAAYSAVSFGLKRVHRPLTEE